MHPFFLFMLLLFPCCWSDAFGLIDSWYIIILASTVLESRRCQYQHVVVQKHSFISHKQPCFFPHWTELDRKLPCRRSAVVKVKWWWCRCKNCVWRTKKIQTDPAVWTSLFLFGTFRRVFSCKNAPCHLSRQRFCSWIRLALLLLLFDYYFFHSWACARKVMDKTSHVFKSSFACVFCCCVLDSEAICLSVVSLSVCFAWSPGCRWLIDSFVRSTCFEHIILPCVRAHHRKRKERSVAASSSFRDDVSRERTFASKKERKKEEDYSFANAVSLSLCLSFDSFTPFLFTLSINQSIDRSIILRNAITNAAENTTDHARLDSSAVVLSSAGTRFIVTSCSCVS